MINQKQRRRKLPLFYIAVEMPGTGLGARHLRYYKSSKDVSKMLQVEQKINPTTWKQTFIGSLLVVPKKHYKHPKRLPDNIEMAYLAKVVGVTRQRPRFIISTTRAQFVLSADWTADNESLNHLIFVKHDYNPTTQDKIERDWYYWRKQENRDFAKRIHDIILAAS